MPVSVPGDTLWEATGHAAATTSVVVTHPDAGGTTAGSTVIVVLRSLAATGFTPPAGWVQDAASGLDALSAWRLDNVAGGVTSWTFTRFTSGNTAWYLRESDHLDFDSFEVFAQGGGGSLASGGTRSTGTSALNAGSSGVVLAVFGSTKTLAANVHSWAGYTNSFTERADFSPAGVVGDTIAVADKAFSGQATFESTATFTNSAGTAANAGAVVLVYRSDDADINAPLAWFTGFEFGTHGGMGNLTTGPLGTVGAGPAGTFGTGYQVRADAARSGGFGLDLTASAGVVNVPLPNLTGNAFVLAGAVQFVSGTGTPDALAVQPVGGSSTNALLRYDVTNQKFGVLWNGGTVVWQTGTTTTSDYPWIEIALRENSSVWHMDWWISTGTGDGSQTSPTDLTGFTPVTSIVPYLGSLTSQTSRFRFDDWVVSRYVAAFPLGSHAVRVLVPEPTGASVSGTAANFNSFTANGTLAAFASTNGDLLDEAPPTVSASSDGVVQVTAAAAEYMNFPMGTLTLDPNEIIAAVRALASLWGGTGTGTGTLGFRGHDGLTETTFVAASTSFDPDSLTAISATYPMWYAVMWSGATNGAWNQTRLDAAALRLGFSTDATPDMGASAMYLEVATRAATAPKVVHSLPQKIDPDPDVLVATVTETLHPYNSALRTYTVTNDAFEGVAVFNYALAGVDQTPVVVNVGDPPVEVVVAAESYGDVTTSFGWA